MYYSDRISILDKSILEQKSWYRVMFMASEKSEIKTCAI